MGKLTFIIMYLVCTLRGIEGQSTCPMECSCDSITEPHTNPPLIHKVVSCDDPDLAEIPSDLPSDFTSLAIAGTQAVPLVKFIKLTRAEVAKARTYDKFVVEYTSLTSVDVDSFQDMKDVSVIRLKNNKLTRLRKGTFSGLSKLYSIDVSGNELCKVDPGTFANIQTLQYLYMGDLKLKILDVTSFQGLTALRSLDLHGNELRKMNKNLFAPLTSLKSLDISDNKLKILHDDGSVLKGLKHLEVTENPWQCNCGIDWMRNVTAVAALSPGSHVECYGPDSLKYQNLVNIPSDQLPCVPPDISCTEDVTVIQGDRATIQCTVTGEPEPDLLWTRPDSELVSEEHEVSGYKMAVGSLTVEEAQEVDAGEWNVRATSVSGSAEAAVQVVVEIPTSTTTSTTTIGVAPPMDMMPIYIGAGAGGGLLLSMIVLICFIRHKKKKDEVKPFKNEVDNDDKHDLTSHPRKRTKSKQ